MARVVRLRLSVVTRAGDGGRRFVPLPHLPVTTRDGRPGWSETGRMPRDEAHVVAQVVLPARAGALGARGVEADACDLHVDVTGVGVDRDPLALARLAPVHEAARVARPTD